MTQTWDKSWPWPRHWEKEVGNRSGTGQEKKNDEEESHLINETGTSQFQPMPWKNFESYEEEKTLKKNMENEEDEGR